MRKLQETIKKSAESPLDSCSFVGKVREENDV